MFTKKKRPYRVNELSDGWNLAFTVIIGIIAIATVMPLVLVVSVSLSTGEDLAKYGYSFIPKNLTFGAYLGLIETGHALAWGYLMTIFYAFAGTILSLLVMSMFAFVLSRRDYPLRNFLTFATFFPTLFSGGLVPTYMLYTQILNIDNTIWVFLLPGIVNVFNVIILRTFIQSNIPSSLFDSARIDGANDWQVYTRIVLPLSKAGLATIGLFRVIGVWNDWFTGVLYVEEWNQRLRPVMTLLQSMQNNINALKNDPGLANDPGVLEKLASMPTESTQMAITLLVSLPLLIAYPFFQKYFVKGMTVGSVKG